MANKKQRLKGGLTMDIIVATINNNTSTYTWDEFHKATFNPLVEYEAIVLGRLRGKTYTEKKAELIAKAVEFQHIDNGGLHMSEYAEIQEYFERYGKRYGLLREFRENGIC